MRNLYFILILLVSLSSCGVNSDLMFRTPTEYEFDDFLEATELEYTISPNDILNFRLFTNDGMQLIEMNTDRGNLQQNLNFSLNYLVRSDSIVELPSLGEINIVGLTVPEAQEKLSNEYVKLYNDPFIQIEVINNRVIVFPGSGGSARVISLTNNNTSVIEALALAGGLTTRGKAKKVKLIRKVNSETEVYLMDLSTIEGIKYANSVVQANDIIYVEPTAEVARELLRDITPVLTLFTSALILYSQIGGN
ncbi:MAG: polysaccharide biosynthesis/export family protein [Flavobacteriales bacterium]